MGPTCLAPQQTFSGYLRAARQRSTETTDSAYKIVSRYQTLFISEEIKQRPLIFDPFAVFYYFFFKAARDHPWSNVFRRFGFVLALTGTQNIEEKKNIQTKRKPHTAPHIKYDAGRNNYSEHLSATRFLFCGAPVDGYVVMRAHRPRPLHDITERIIIVERYGETVLQRLGRVISSCDGMSEDRVLILGGCGFIGRHFVKYLVDNNLASAVRVVDKVPPQIAWLNDDHKAAFESPLVEFHSANLIHQSSCENAFEGSFDYAINCAGETRVDLPDAIYDERIFKLSMNCARAAAKYGIRRYVEVSSGQFTGNHKGPIKEDDKVVPLTSVAKYKYEVEKKMKNIPNLIYTIVRPAIVYGIGDRTGLTPNLVIGSLYRSLGEPVRILWKGSTACNTVHVEDVCRAVWHLSKLPKAAGETYNLVDTGETTQDMIAEIVSSLFGVKHEFLGTVISSLCKNDLDVIASEANDKHSIPWAEACAKSNVHNTPLSPFIQKDQLTGYRVQMTGNKLMNIPNFTLKYPRITAELLKQVIDDFIQMNLFPKTLLDLAC